MRYMGFTELLTLIKLFITLQSVRFSVCKFISIFKKEKNHPQGVEFKDGTLLSHRLPEISDLATLSVKATRDSTVVWS